MHAEHPNYMAKDGLIVHLICYMEKLAICGFYPYLCLIFLASEAYIYNVI